MKVHASKILRCALAFVLTISMIPSTALAETSATTAGVVNTADSQISTQANTQAGAQAQSVTLTDSQSTQNIASGGVNP